MAAASNENSSTSTQGLWLVKSGDRILGPYSTDDLSKLIREKEVVVIDEVMAPQKRWAYIRDVEAFKAAVEDLRSGLMTSREDTEIAGYTSPARVSEPVKRSGETPVSPSSAADHTQTSVTGSAVTLAGRSDDETLVSDTIVDDDTIVTQTLSGPGAASGATSAAPTPSGPIASQSNPQKTKPVSVARPTSKTPSLAMEPLPHHSREGQQAAAQAASAKSKNYVRPKTGGRAGLVLGAAVLIIVVALIIYTVLKSPQAASVADSGSLSTQAAVAWKRGEFDRALELYRALNSNQSGQPQVAARLALLLMRLEGQTVEAKRIIASAQANASSESDKSELAIASGLASLQSDDAKDAVAQFSLAGSNWIAAFDKGVALSMLKDWDGATKSLKAAGENAVSMLMLARTSLSAGEAGAIAKVTARKQADEAIRKALIGAPDYQQESLLVAAYIDAVSGNEKRASKELADAVEIDPNQTSDHFHEPGLSLDQVSWTRLLPYCDQLNSQLNSNVSRAMLGVCLAKANRIEDATKLIDGALAKESTDPQLQAVNAYLSTLADREDAARASLTLSAKSGPSKLAQILSARLCMREKQDACAEEAWSKLASEPNPPIASITGLALLRQQKGDAEGANALLVKAETLSPTYLPLLRLREDASR